jgi:hypothetical protein
MNAVEWWPYLLLNIGANAFKRPLAVAAGQRYGAIWMRWPVNLIDHQPVTSLQPERAK